MSKAAKFAMLPVMAFFGLAAIGELAFGRWHEECAAPLRIEGMSEKDIYDICGW